MKERERTTAPREYTSRERKTNGHPSGQEEREKLPAEVSEWKRECVEFLFSL